VITEEGAAAPGSTGAVVPRLGIGLNYQGPLRDFIEREPETFDFLEVIPDLLWTDRGRGARPRYVEEADGVGFVERVAETKPVIAHSIGLSIGSAHRFNRAHVRQIAEWYERLRFPWHSDHLAYNLAEHAEESDQGQPEINLGVTLPLPLDQETLTLLVPRVEAVRRSVPVPFLLENNVYYFELPEQELDEAEFLNELCRRSGCWMLLDLHNLYTNARNHHFDPIEHLERLDFDRVLEIHVAGGVEYEGFYLDAHSGPIAPPVLDLLEWTLPRVPNLGGVVFEIFGSWFADLGSARLRGELDRLRELWAQHVGGVDGGVDAARSA
jgi:uncharacterized protein (UPF0276 family)